MQTTALFNVQQCAYVTTLPFPLVTRLALIQPDTPFPPQPLQTFPLDAARSHALLIRLATVIPRGRGGSTDTR